jgi:hypothetical protein
METFSERRLKKIVKGIEMTGGEGVPLRLRGKEANITSPEAHSEAIG